ncbi:hypothetical protein CYLTODRAFT_493068 [Cylindrobasidium torrendii FP15055 ss-10]|uniref:Uncharacterized protein n=1 Tax=Cylindrobasidium torrendii FP15055 ss-10 TaxID=1314674 RepID=A0A0D7B2T6_9AGAR|nr:hypothetical protein CYLTODRAFT_493068 [Cylindrobasidium torrendii FP15055 ss-10]
MSPVPRNGFYEPCSSSSLPSDIVPGVPDPFGIRGLPPPYTRRRPLPPIPQPVITEIVPDSPQQTSPQQTSPVSSARSTHAETPTTDYQPTLRPTYGRPLLNGNLVLVFPIGHERCPKCRDTGYKLSHPYDHKLCNKCWQKYGRPFTGPLTFSADFSPDAPYRDTLQQPINWGHSPSRSVQQAAQTTGGHARGASIASTNGRGTDNVFAHPDWGKKKKCKTCRGHGIVYVLSVGDACPACRGTGY